MATDVNLGNLDGKARLAERCKPLLAQIPDGAFGDLMKQRLVELTGVGARASTPDTHVPVQRARNRRPCRRRRRAWCAARSRCCCSSRRWPCRCRRPTASPRCANRAWSAGRHDRRGARTPRHHHRRLLEHFSRRDEAAALQKLAMESNLYEHGEAEPEFRGILRMLELQYLEQRIAELNRELTERGLSSLSDGEKLELRELPVQINALKRELAPAQ
jgi:DNA primase